MGWENANWINMAEKEKWGDLVNKVMNLHIQ